MVVQHKSYPICPPWLKPLISSKFFDPCNNHTTNSSPSSGGAADQPSSSGATRIECNLFCLDCMDKPLCFGCTFGHKNHHVVQIRRSSYHDVIRVSEIQKVLDLSGIQSYIINSARVVFLNGRPQTKLAKGVTKTCEICERSLNENFRYCSLGCKLQGLSKHSELSFAVQPKPQIGNGNHRVYPEDGVSSHKKSRTRKAAKLDSFQPQPQPQQQAEQEQSGTANATEKISPSSPCDEQQQQQVQSHQDKAKVKEEETGRTGYSREFRRLSGIGGGSGGGGGGGGKKEESLGPVEIWPSTPPQVMTWTEGMSPGRAKRRKGTPHRSHLG